MIYEYRVRQLFKKLGLSGTDDLNDFEIQAFLLIESEIDKQQERQSKRKTR